MKPKWFLAMKQLFLDAEGELSEEEKKKKEEEEKEKSKDAEGSVEERLSKIETVLAKLVKTDEEVHAEKDKKAKDARDAEEEEKKEKKKDDEEEEVKDCFGKSKDAAPIFQEVLYRSSILAPNLSLPTHDSVEKLNKKQFNDACCLIKRKSLDAAYSTEDGKAAINPLVAGKTVDFLTADCTTVDFVFVGASEIIKAAKGDRVKTTVHDFGRATTVASINQKNREFWAARNNGGKN